MSGGTPMRILQVAAVDYTAKYIMKPLIDELSRKGHTVEIACKYGSDGEELLRMGYVLHNIPFYKNLNPVHHLRSLYYIWSLLKKGRYDCVHVHTPIASVLTRIAAKMAGVDCIIYSAHGFHFTEHTPRWKYRFSYWIEKWWGRFFTDWLFLVSKEDYEVALNGKFTLPDQIVHISNGVNEDSFNPSLYNRETFRRALKIDKEDVVFLFVGRMVHEKGIRELLEAFSKVCKRSSSVKLLMVGGVFEGERDVADNKRILDELSDDCLNRIIFLGKRDDVPEIMNAADVFVLPSYREGLPLSIIEAMAMGKAVIASRIRGCRELVLDQQNGLLCNRKDVDDLVRAMGCYAQDQELIGKHGVKSRELFMEHYRLKKALEIQLKVYADIEKKLNRL
jgi:glycosyltransferase involved in cell wall biosynthesis